MRTRARSVQAPASSERASAGMMEAHLPRDQPTAVVLVKVAAQRFEERLRRRALAALLCPHQQLHRRLIQQEERLGSNGRE